MKVVCAHSQEEAEKAQVCISAGTEAEQADGVISGIGAPSSGWLVLSAEAQEGTTFPQYYPEKPLHPTPISPHTYLSSPNGVS